MSDALPDYERHPLDETVMGVQFEPLKQVSFRHLLDYWWKIRDRYPQIEEQPPIPHIVEKPKLEPHGNQVFISALPLPRFLLAEKVGNTLIQVQNDRFMRNWRMQDGSEVYPRFNTLFPAFWQDWKGFQEFLEEEKLLGPKVDQCELTYVNFIDVDQVKGGLSGMESAFSFLQERNPNSFLPPPLMTKWESSYELPDGRGRLHAAATPNFRARDLKLVVNFSLTARGTPAGMSDIQVTSWFELAHEWIVRGFDELTTPEMHKVWGKKT
jgi:uncharacterized protein (TIGR04255 family)